MGNRSSTHQNNNSFIGPHVKPSGQGCIKGEMILSHINGINDPNGGHDTPVGSIVSGFQMKYLSDHVKSCKDCNTSDMGNRL